MLENLVKAGAYPKRYFQVDFVSALQIIVVCLELHYRHGAQ